MDIQTLVLSELWGNGIVVNMVSNQTKNDSNKLLVITIDTLMDIPSRVFHQSEPIKKKRTFKWQNLWILVVPPLLSIPFNWKIALI